MKNFFFNVQYKLHLKIYNGLSPCTVQQVNIVAAGTRFYRC